MIPCLHQKFKSMSMTFFIVTETHMERGGTGGLACYIRNDLSYNVKSYFPKDIENIFFELPNTMKIMKIWRLLVLCYPRTCHCVIIVLSLCYHCVITVYHVLSLCYHCVITVLSFSFCF